MLETIYWFLIIGIIPYPFTFASAVVWVIISFSLFMANRQIESSKKMLMLWIAIILFYLFTFVVQIFIMVFMFGKAFTATLAVLIYTLLGYIIFRLYLKFWEEKKNTQA